MSIARPQMMLLGLVASVAVAAFAAGYTTGDQGGVSNEDLAAIILQMRQEQSRQAPAAAQIKVPEAPLFVSTDDDPAIGNSDAGITIIEFSDFQCPSCNKFYHQVLPQLERKYIDTGEVRFVYRDMPLNIHENAVPAHIAAECAHEQGAFWEYHDILFERQQEWGRLDPSGLEARLQEYADELNLESGFAGCLDSPDILQEVRKDLAQARGYGATGTPTFFVGNDDVGYLKLAGVHPFETFESIIESSKR